MAARNLAVRYNISKYPLECDNCFVDHTLDAFTRNLDCKTRNEMYRCLDREAMTQNSEPDLAQRVIEILEKRRARLQETMAQTQDMMAPNFVVMGEVIGLTEAIQVIKEEQ